MKTVIFYQRVLVAIILACIAALTGCDSQSIEEKQVNVVFRFDDYEVNDYATLSSTDMELKIIDAFRKYKLSITFGVVPSTCANYEHHPSIQDSIPPSMKKIYLKKGFEDGVLDIALHGYSHQNISAKSATEFRGLDYNSQLEKLAKGKALLEDIVDAPITTFIPPWNSYDLNTLRALEKLGFSTLSANRSGEATKESELNFLPLTCGLLEVRDAVKAARASCETQPVIVVCFHLFEFKEIDQKLGIITYQEFSDLLKWLTSQQNVNLLSVSQASKIIKDLSANRFIFDQWYFRLSRLLPKSLQQQEFETLYQESPCLLSRTILFLTFSGFYILIVCIGAILSFVIGILVFPRSKLFMNILIVGSIALSIIMLIYKFIVPQVYLTGMVAVACVVGTSLGLCICYLYLEKKALGSE